MLCLASNFNVRSKDDSPNSTISIFQIGTVVAIILHWEWRNMFQSKNKAMSDAIWKFWSSLQSCKMHPTFRSCIIDQGLTTCIMTLTTSREQMSSKKCSAVEHSELSKLYLHFELRASSFWAHERLVSLVWKTENCRY